MMKEKFFYELMKIIIDTIDIIFETKKIFQFIIANDYLCMHYEIIETISKSMSWIILITSYIYNGHNDNNDDTVQDLRLTFILVYYFFINKKKSKQQQQ